MTAGAVKSISSLWRGLQKGGLRVKKSFFTFFAIRIDFEMLFQVAKTEKSYLNFLSLESRIKILAQ